MTDLYENYVPERFKGRTGYQIFVDRFCLEGPKPKPMEGRELKEWSDSTPNWKPDADGEYRNQYFYAGNLRGIISKLDYLESLGFDLLYLSPISFTRSSHHYDVENQTQIDPWIGTWDDFKELCKLAHSKDILICVDLVFNHMGSQSKFFQEALQNRSSRYRQWFEWDNKGNPIFWYGFKDMPQCNKLNLNYQEYAYSTAEYYIKMGADGIRLDLGENLPREFMQGLRKRVKKINPEILIVNELWGFATHKENLQINGDQADSFMNYTLSDAILRWIRYGNEKHFEYTRQELSKYPKQMQDVLWNHLDSHDTPRVRNMLVGAGMNEDPFEGYIWDIEAPWRKKGGFDTFGFRKWEEENDHLDDELAKKRLMLSSLLQYFEKGVPIVYYGTEVNMSGYKDPFNRKPYEWNKRLSKECNFLSHYKTLGIFRKMNKDILSDGNIEELVVNKDTLLMVRESKVGALILVMNRSGYNQQNPIKEWNTNGWKEVLKVQDGTKDTLAPYSAIVYRNDN